MVVRQGDKLVEVRCAWWIKPFSMYISKPLARIGLPLPSSFIVWLTNHSMQGRTIWPTPGPWKRMAVSNG